MNLGHVFIGNQCAVVVPLVLNHFCNTQIGLWLRESRLYGTTKLGFGSLVLGGVAVALPEAVANLCLVRSGLYLAVGLAVEQNGLGVFLAFIVVVTLTGNLRTLGNIFLFGLLCPYRGGRKPKNYAKAEGKRKSCIHSKFGISSAENTKITNHKG